MKRTVAISRVICIALAFALLTFTMAGCAKSNASTSTAPSASNMFSAAYEAEKTAEDYDSSYLMDMASGEIPEEAGGFSGGTATAAQQEQSNAVSGTINRKIIKTVHIQMETLEYDALLESLTAKTAEFGGYIESSSVSGYGVNQRLDDTYIPTRYAFVVVRIPTARLDEFTALVGTLGNITQKDENSEDITLTYADTEARKAALTVEYDRLMELLEKADTLEAIVALESRLSDVRYELDSLGSALRRYDSLIDYSTVNINIQETRRLTPTQNTPKTIGSRIATGFKETMLDIRDGAEDFVVWFVVNLPYLVIWAAIITAIVLIIRRIIKKQKAKKPAAPGFYPPVVNTNNPQPPKPTTEDNNKDNK